MTDRRDDADELPPRLQRDLRRLLGAAPRLPESLTAALVQAARRELRPRRQWRPWLLSSAAAAAVLLAVWACRPRSVREDFDGNGRIDVVDAYRLALALQRREQVPARFDLDGDGRVDRDDVRAIATRAVAVRG